MTKPNIPKLNAISHSDWDWLVGLYYADGCRFMDRWHHVTVFTIALSESHVLEKLLRILHSLGLLPSVYRKHGRRAFDIRSYSRNLFGRLPDKSSRYEPQVPLAYLAGLFDGDGSVGRFGGSERWVFSQAKYPHLAPQVCEIVSPYGRTTLSKEAEWMVADLKSPRPERC